MGYNEGMTEAPNLNYDTGMAAGTVSAISCLYDVAQEHVAAIPPFPDGKGLALFFGAVGGVLMFDSFRRPNDTGTLIYEAPLPDPIVVDIRTRRPLDVVPEAPTPIPTREKVRNALTGVATVAAGVVGYRIGSDVSQSIGLALSGGAFGIGTAAGYLRYRMR